MMTFPSNFIEHCKESHSLPDICCPNPGMELNEVEIKQLYDCLSKQYISHEFHPTVVQLVKRLSAYISENE